MHDNLGNDVLDALRGIHHEANKALKDVYAMMYFLAAAGVVGVLCMLGIGMLR